MWERQQNITPAETLRAAHYVARSGGWGTPLISDARHFVRLVIGGLLLGIGVISFKSDIPHGTLLGIIAVIAGICLAITAIQWKDERR